MCYWGAQDASKDIGCEGDKRHYGSVAGGGWGLKASFGRCICCRWESFIGEGKAGAGERGPWGQQERMDMAHGPERGRGAALPRTFSSVPRKRSSKAVS